MSQLIQSFYRDVQTACRTENESQLVTYLSNDGLVLLKQLLLTEIRSPFNPIECRDFGLFLVKLIPVCYSHVPDDDTEQALLHLPSINNHFDQIPADKSTLPPSPLLETLDSIFDTLVHLFYFQSNVAVNPSKSELDSAHLAIAQAFVQLTLPTFHTDPKILWFYQKIVRSLLLIFQHILFSQPSTFAETFPSNPIGTLINTVHQYLSSSSALPSPVLIQFAFDLLQGFALLIERTLARLGQLASAQPRATNDLLNLINQFLTSDYFPLFILLNANKHCDTNSKALLEHCSNVLKSLKIYRSEHCYRKQNRRSVKASWENNSEQAHRFHSHQTIFEITIPNRPSSDGPVDVDEGGQTKRICIVSAIYDKILRLAIKQLESSRPSWTFVQDCLSSLISAGSCSCYSLSHYRTLLSKFNHLKLEKLRVAVEQQSIQLLRQAFLLISQCAQRAHHHHELSSPDQTHFWSYLGTHLFQRPTDYSLQLARAFPELIQCCSSTEKQLALKVCLIPTLEYFRANATSQTAMIEYLVQTLPNLLFDMHIDLPLLPFSDTLIALSSLFPSLLHHTLPVLGCLLTSSSNSIALEISEAFIQLIIKLTNSWTLTTEDTDNLCHILIILLQKSSTFRQAFYARQCHSRLYERFQSIVDGKSPIQSSILASILVSISYYPKSLDHEFTYRRMLDDITRFSEQHRYNQSWFELLVRLSLSKQYQDRRTRWKSSNINRNPISTDDEQTNTSDSFVDPDNDDAREETDPEENYQADVESLSDDMPRETVTKQSPLTYSNLILFPELVILGLKIAWQNVDHEWNDNSSTPKTPIYVTNLVTYLEILSSLVRANSYNSFILKKLNLDEYLFHCLMTIVRRSAFLQKDALITLIITLLQFIWSQSITVHQLDQCFKLILAHRSLLAPLLRLFKHLVHQIDSNQPRSFCSMPLSSIVTSKGGNNSRLTLDQLLILKYPPTDSRSNGQQSVRQSAFVTETLKNVQFQYPLTVAIWLKVNYPFDKHETMAESPDDEETTKKETRPWLHVLTLHHEGIQLQFWLDSTPHLCFRIVQLLPNSNPAQTTDFTVRLSSLPRESWSHVFVTISKASSTVSICLNGQTSLVKEHVLPAMYSSNSTKPWSISLGQQSLDTCTSFYYDLGSILLFDKADLSNGTNHDHLSTYLFSLGSDHWHFLTGGQQQQQQISMMNYWIYQRFTRVQSAMLLDQFEIKQNAWHSNLKRSIVASFSSCNPWTLFLFNGNVETPEDPSTSLLTKILPFRSSTSSSSSSTTASSAVTTNDDGLLCTTATISLPSKISVEQSSHILNTCEQLGGILNFIYLFGKIIEINAYPSSLCVCHISDIIFTSIWKIKSYYDLFQSLDGYRLIVKILTTSDCARHITQPFYELLVEKCIVPNQQRLYDINLFRFLLLDWKIWYNHSKIFHEILQLSNSILSDQSNPKYFHVNRQQFKMHFTLEHLLTLCQEIIEEQQQIVIDDKLTRLLVNIIEGLIEHDINVIALLMNFVLVIHPLIKTYVTYNKEHFYFISKSFDYYLKRDEYHQENGREHVKQRMDWRRKERNRSTTIVTDDATETLLITKDTSSIRKSRSFADLLGSAVTIANDNDSHGSRRSHHLTVSNAVTTLSPSKTFNIDSTSMGHKDSLHNIDHLSAGILRLLTNLALTTPDRLMMKLIDHVFRLNILTVLLLDASMDKRVECLRLLDIVLKRMDREKVRSDVVRADLHTMLANQLYHQLDGRDDERELMEICVSIALQRPIQFDLKRSLAEQIDDADQYYSIISSLPSCPRSQVGFALTLSLVEKLSLTNSLLCEFLLQLLDEILRRSTDENRHFLVDIGLTQVLFNTLSSAIVLSHDKLIQAVQNCLNSLITKMFITAINDDISFVSIIHNLLGTIMIKSDKSDHEAWTNYRRVVHQTLSGMFCSIIDSIEKPPSMDLSTYKSGIRRASVDDTNGNSTPPETYERFRQLLQLTLDYIYHFHHECLWMENVTLRLLDVCLLTMAYLIEKRSNQGTSRHQWSLVMFRSGDIIKQIGQKLLPIALDPDKQRFFFRIEILKHIIQQPNSKAILEYLLTNDQQGSIFHQILIYLHVMTNTTPSHSDYEQLTNQQPNSNALERSTAGPMLVRSQTVSNGEESSHTVNICVKTPVSKLVESSTKRHVKIKVTSEHSSSENDEAALAECLNSSATIDNEQETAVQKNGTRSLSPSLSISSVGSEINTSLQQSSPINYSGTLITFRDLMRTVNVQSPTTVDNVQAQRRILTDYLLASSSSSSTPLNTLRNTSATLPQRQSFNWPSSVTQSEAQSNTNAQTPGSPDRSRRRSQMPTPSPSPAVITWSTVVENKRAEYQQSLSLSIEIIQRRSQTTQKNSLETFTQETIAAITARAMEITQEVINLQGLERKRFLEHLRLNQSLDLRTKHLWHQLISQLTHEYGIWFEAGSYPKFWELDPTENPQRERRRLQRSYCLMEKRFFQTHVPDEVIVNPPLSYLFDTRHYQSINIQTVLHRNEKIEYQCRCMNVTPNNEIKGELLVGTTRIYFVADEQLLTVNKSKSINSAMTTIGYNHHSFNDDSKSFSFAIDDICEMHRRRYMLKDMALELFLINGITWMIAHVTTNDRENLYRLLSKRDLIHFRKEEVLTEIQASWKQGHITNFEYLMQLNKLAGRTYLDLMQYPVYPYVTATYDTAVLDLRSPANYRNLARPIAIQHPEKEEKFIEIYRALEEAHNIALQQEQDGGEHEAISAVFGHQSKPYHFASLYSNSGVVLHYLVRLLPYTRMFLDYQDKNFDCADRTFHDVKTSYWLSSFESTSDFKELIPEFYYLHEFLLNKQGFNFGTRQSGEKVSDVTLTQWSKRNARLFVCGLRQALESEYVTTHLHHWIDLIFGSKQLDKAALDAINVYHAACYYGFPIDSINDQLTQSAYYGIIRTYGQVPKQLFRQAHPAATMSNSLLSSGSSSTGGDKRSSERLVFESKLPLESIHRQIVGVRWGDFIGSYDMASPDYITHYDGPVQIKSFVALNTGSCIICLPSSALIIYNEYMTNESVRRSVSSESSSTLNSSQSSSASLDAMIALKWNTPDGVVRCRQLRQVKNWYNFLVPMDDQDKITCCASIDCRLLFMGKTSGLIEVYRIQRSRTMPAGLELIKRYLPFIAHRSPITALHVNRQFSLLISTSADGMLTLWDTNRLSYVRTYKQDNHSIYHLTSSETTGDIAYLSSCGSQWHLSYLTCNCDLIGSLAFADQLNCLCFTSAPEGTCVNVLLGGFENGLISMWSTWDLTLLRQLDIEKLRSCPIIALCVSKVDRRRLYVADRDRHLHLIESRLSSSSSSSSSQSQPQILFLS